MALASPAVLSPPSNEGPVPESGSGGREGTAPCLSARGVSAGGGGSAARQQADGQGQGGEEGAQPLQGLCHRVLTPGPVLTLGSGRPGGLSQPPSQGLPPRLVPEPLGETGGFW